MQKLERAHALESSVAAGMELKPLSSLISKRQAQEMGISDEVLQAGVVIEVDLTSHEAKVPNGTSLPDRYGHFHAETGDPIKDKFTQPLFTLSEWKDSYDWEKDPLETNHSPQLLINTSWFNIWESGQQGVGEKMKLRTQPRTFLAGLCISDGEMISTADALDQGGVGLDAIIIDNNNSSIRLVEHASVDQYVAEKQRSLSSVSAASGFIIRKNGETQKTPEVNNNHSNAVPRMGIGISKDGSKMIIVSIQTSQRKSGVTVEQFSNIFEKLNCADAINLDNVGSVELLYDGPDNMGRKQRFQTVTADSINLEQKNGKNDSERPKPAVMSFAYRTPARQGLTKDDMFVPDKKTYEYSLILKSSEEGDVQDPRQPKHDSYFNDREKIKKESEMAIQFMNHVSYVEDPCKKISNKLSVIFSKLFSELQSGIDDPLRDEFTHFMMNEQIDFHVIYKTPNITPENLFLAILQDLNAETLDENIFYRQMCISRAFIVFLAEKGKLTPEGIRAKENNWLGDLFDLTKFEKDIKTYRGNLFEKNLRKKREFKPDSNKRDESVKSIPSIFKRLSSKTGVYAPEDEAAGMEHQLQLHQPGKSDFFITTQGAFTKEGMHELDMPQLCGPSGMTAMRMALANQCSLSSEEMQKYHYGVSMYHVAIGAHTFDECFSIGQDQDWNVYQRGDYSSAEVKFDSGLLDSDSIATASDDSLSSDDGHTPHHGS
jgi:hypothetical protein